MSRMLIGSIVTLLLVAAGLFWWQGLVDEAPQGLVAQTMPVTRAPDLPPEGNAALTGAPPPMPPGADPQTREQKRFDRYDRNRDGAVTRPEMMSTRSAAFRKLDKDGNNLLSFEEWAVATSDRFAGADANKDARLSRAEFATTARKPKPATPSCSCGETKGDDD